MNEHEKEKNTKITMQKKKCFVCRGFRHIIHYCRNMESRKKELTPMPSNKFEVLTSKVMNIGEDSTREMKKNRKTILRKD